MRGENALKNDWYEYVEFGTSNNHVILLQKYGFLREEALDLIKSPYLNHIVFDKSLLTIKKTILDVAPNDMRNSLTRAAINYPEIFVE